MLLTNFFYELAKGVGMVHGEVGQDFPVEGYLVFFELMDKLAVGEIHLREGGVDTYDPEWTKVSFFLFTVDVSVLQPFFNGIFSYGEYIFSSTEVAFGKL